MISCFVASAISGALRRASSLKTILESVAPRLVVGLLYLALGLSAEPGALAASVSDGTVEVRVEQGALRCLASSGTVKCLGVPYAAAPVGPLRFRAPISAPGWQGLRDATHFGSSCLQVKTEYDPQQGSEDCLYLNIYVPKTVISPPNARLPVMVWLHGGGFVSGSGNAFNGERLAHTAGAIIVTINYRLGPLGWLALPSLAAETPDHSTGNYGLRDSIAALKWVQRNIAAFGGDTQRVTLFGQSAGGEQTLALIASPLAAGLFQRAISMSAPASIPLPTLEAAIKKHKSFVDELGCNDAKSQPDCLRKLPAQKILDSAHINWDFVDDGGLQWTPVIDGAVLPQPRLSLFKQGKFNKVPVIVGHTKNEANLFVAISENDRGEPVSSSNLEKSVKLFFGPFAKAVLSAYPEEAGLSPAERLAHIITDQWFGPGLTNDRAALAKETPVYGYESCDPDAPASHVHPLYSKLGCSHDSDLAYLFQWDDFSSKIPKFDADQWALAKAMGQYWGNFAATGNPNGPDLPRWPEQTVDNAFIQELSPANAGGVRTISANDYAREHHLEFWESLPITKH